MEPGLVLTEEKKLKRLQRAHEKKAKRLRSLQKHTKQEQQQGFGAVHTDKQVRDPTKYKKVYIQPKQQEGEDSGLETPESTSSFTGCFTSSKRTKASSPESTSDNLQETFSDEKITYSSSSICALYARLPALIPIWQNHSTDAFQSNGGSCSETISARTYAFPSSPPPPLQQQQQFLQIYPNAAEYFDSPNSNLIYNKFKGDKIYEATHAMSLPTYDTAARPKVR